MHRRTKNILQVRVCDSTLFLLHDDMLCGYMYVYIYMKEEKKNTRRLTCERETRIDERWLPGSPAAGNPPFVICFHDPLDQWRGPHCDLHSKKQKKNPKVYTEIYFFFLIHISAINKTNCSINITKTQKNHTITLW